MRYQGGKSRIAKPIAEKIAERTFGGGNAWLACFAARAQWRVRWQAILTSLY